MPDGMDAAQRDFGQAVEAHLAMSHDDLDGDQARGEAIFRATASMPLGPQALACRLGEDIDDLGVSMIREQALEDLFGRRADRLCAENGLRLDPMTRRKLLQQIGEVYLLLIGKLKRNSAGDYSPDGNLNRFPAMAAAKPAITSAGRHTVASVFERWKAEFADKRSASTIRR